MLKQMANPDYATLLPQIAAESDPTAKQALIDQCYVFETTPTVSEQNLFNYMESDYVEDNPGNTDDSSSADSSTLFSAYAGVYFNNDGEST
jgi:hypothetical protein|tara:strand:- start:287 stop:559 length:273 start_codon:yes stop_codon:yes gene_type:complete